MTTQTKRPRPEGLGEAGRSLWDAVTAVLRLDEHEAVALLQVCRTADTLDKLQAIVDREGAESESSQGPKAHWALVELRQQRIAFARLLAALRLPAGIADAAKRQRGKQSQAVPPQAEPLAVAQRRVGVRGVHVINGGLS